MTFGSWRDFDTFAHDVKFNNRFIHSPKVLEFFSNIKNTLLTREKELSAGSILYRSQIGYDEIALEQGFIIQGFPVERMKPRLNNGWEGRANPKGISYLYLSSDENTSLAELRPHIGQKISSAQFKVKKDIKFVDCYSMSKHYSFVECFLNPPGTQEEIVNAVWSMINCAFTKPIVNHEHNSEYVPTQILAEYFKSEGFDGICYKSGVSDGLNFILFSPSDATLINCTVMETLKVKYEFEECADRYFVEK